MANIDFAGMSDSDFEEMLEAGHSPESTEEAPSEPSAVSGEEVEPEGQDAVNSPEEASEEQSEVLDEDEAQPEVLSDEEETDEDVEEESNPTDEPVTDSGFKAIKLKASGQEIEVRSEEERDRLLQMGFDYSQKMQGFKQHRKTIKTLEQHKIDDATLNLLIDAHKGNPQAIAKLVKDHDIDTMDLDTEDSGYTPTDNHVSDGQVELDDVISRIQDTPTFSRTSDLVSNQWDAASKKVVFEHPEYIEVLNTQIANGTYDRVMQEVNRAKVFGGLQNLSDLEAYQKVGMEMQRNGAFDQTAPEQVSTAPKQDKPTNTEQKRRAAKPKKTPKTPKAPKKYDYAAMSDAEFEKLLNGRG